MVVIPCDGRIIALYIACSSTNTASIEGANLTLTTRAPTDDELKEYPNSNVVVVVPSGTGLIGAHKLNVKTDCGCFYQGVYFNCPAPVQKGTETLTDRGSNNYCCTEETT